VYKSRATKAESLPEKMTRKCSIRGCSETKAYATSHICGIDGRSADQETVTYGDLRARAQELLSPRGGIILSARKAALLNHNALLCSGVGVGIP